MTVKGSAKVKLNDLMMPKNAITSIKKKCLIIGKTNTKNLKKTKFNRTNKLRTTTKNSKRN